MMSAQIGYATALLKAAIERGCVARIADDLLIIDELFAGSARFFYNPMITVRAKAKALNELLDGRTDALTVQFAVLLAQRKRLKYLPEVRRQYEKMAAVTLGKLVVRIWIPYEPSDALMSRFRDYLAEAGLYPPDRKDEVSFDIITDKRLIGGFIAESGGRMLDLSLKTRLDRLRHSKAQ